MAQPLGFINPHNPKVVFLLKKALYGRKQALRACFSRLSSRLLELGFTISKANSSLFLFQAARTRLMALVYVDDILLTRSSSAALDSLVQVLSSNFPIKDLGPLAYFLGVEVTQTTAGLHLSQQHYPRFTPSHQHGLR